MHTLLPMTKGSITGDAHHFRVREKMRAGKNVALVNKVMDEFKHVVKGVHLPANRVAKMIDHNRFFRVLWKMHPAGCTTTTRVRFCLLNGECGTGSRRPCAGPQRFFKLCYTEWAGSDPRRVPAHLCLFLRPLHP